MLDADNGRIMDANPLIVKQLGYSRGDLLGKELWEIGFFEDATAGRRVPSL
jgi:PAS domain S-box-containing protein